MPDPRTRSPLVGERRCCRYCWGPKEPGPEHQMRCRFYVGPLRHEWVKLGWNGTFGGLDHWCSCGGWFRQGGLAGHGDGSEDAAPICPNVDQEWRGPRPAAGGDRAHPAGLPDEAVRAAAEAIERELMSGRDYAMAMDSDEALARVALTAALPHLRDAIAADMRTALQDAIELAEDGLAYTSDWFCGKWGMDDKLARLKAVLAEHSGGTPQRGDTEGT